MKRQLFVGSSAETKLLAEAVRAHLRDLVDVDIWDQNIFELGKGTLETLLRAPPKNDFAVFILGPDDEIVYRGAWGKIPRANVLFELGLFMGALGSTRVFAMFSDQKDLIIPNDFAGVTVTRYTAAGLDPKNFDSYMAATRSACDTIRLSILRYKPPVPPERSYILTDRTVLSISSYLSLKQEDVRIAIDSDNEKTALRQFDRDCHDVLSGLDIYGLIKAALGAPFGLYVQAIGAVGEHTDDIRNLNCCVRTSEDTKAITYLDRLMSKDPNRPKKGYIGKDIRKLFKKKPAFGQWLLSSNLDPVPLAVIVDCSEKSDWDAKIISAYNTPLGFRIDASGTSSNYDLARAKLLKGKVKLSLGGLDDRFKSLKKMLSKNDDDHDDPADDYQDDGDDDDDRYEENYMGTIVKSVLFVPIHGWPGITLQILTRERLEIDTQTPEVTAPAAETEDSIRLTIDELMSIRLCGERAAEPVGAQG